MTEGEDYVPGTMEAQAQLDLERLGKLDTGVRGSLAKLALLLARKIDMLADDAAPSTVARLSQEYRATLDRLMGVSSSDGAGIRQLFEMLQEPLRRAEDEARGHG